MDSWIEELERLGRLRGEGVLTDGEFEALKSRLLQISDEELDTGAVSAETGPEDLDAITDEDDQEDLAAAVDSEEAEPEEQEPQSAPGLRKPPVDGGIQPSLLDSIHGGRSPVRCTACVPILTIRRERIQTRGTKLSDRWRRRR